MLMRKAFFVAGAIAVANEFKADAVLLKVVPSVNPTQLPVRGDQVESALDVVNNSGATVEIDLGSSEAADGAPEGAIAIDISNVKGDEVTEVPRRTTEEAKNPVDGVRESLMRSLVKEHYGKILVFLVAVGILVKFLIPNGDNFDVTTTSTTPPPPAQTTNMPVDPFYGEFNTETDLMPALMKRASCTSEACVHEKLSSLAGFNPVTEDTPSCSALTGTCTNFYTVPRYLKDYSEVFPKFRSETEAVTSLIISIAHAVTEADNFNTCAEYLMIPAEDQITGEEVPCNAPGQFGTECMKTADGKYMDPKGNYMNHDFGGRIAALGDAGTFGYSSVQAAKRGFEGNGLYCKDLSGNFVDRPENGCTDPYGNLLTGEMAKECYYGRGLKQLSFPHNYGNVMNSLLGAWLKAAGRVAPDFCHTPDAICTNPEYAVKSGLLFVKENVLKDETAWRFFTQWMNGIAPQNNQGNQKRVDDAKRLAEALDVTCIVEGTAERGGVQYENLVCEEAVVSSTPAVTSSAAAAGDNTNQASVGPVAPVTSTNTPTITAGPSPAPTPESSTAGAEDADCFATGQGCDSSHCPNGQVAYGAPGVHKGCACASADAPSNWDAAMASSTPCGASQCYLDGTGCNNRDCPVDQEAFGVPTSMSANGCSCGKDAEKAHSNPSRCGSNPRN